MEGQVIVSLKFLWNVTALIILMANDLLQPGLGFVLWLVGNTRGALAVRLAFSAPGLTVHKYLLGKK